jgi:hypothetical protein
MATETKKNGEFSDAEVEDILDMQAPKDLLREFQRTVQDNPLLVTGLVFTFGLLVGVALSSGQRRD